MSLHAQGVSKRYGPVAAVDAVTLSVAEGECVALVGESGSGKSTLLRMFNRMVKPDTGRVLVDGQDAASMDPVALRRRIGYVPQEGGLMPHWTALRNASLVPWLEGHADPAGDARAALELVGLEPARFAARMPAELSGGQRQRVAIARALAARPRLLLLDEPFGALDAITRSELHELFGRLRGEIRTTTILVTHDLAEAARLGDQVAVLRAGRLEQVGPPREVYGRPGTPYVADLVRRAGVHA